MSFEPSTYQQAIFDEVSTDSKEHLQVNAVAGSGKTTSMVQCTHRVKGDSIFVAFNKHIADALQAKLNGSARAQTLHSVGLQTLGADRERPRVETDKYRKMVKAAMEKRKLPLTMRHQLQDLVDFSRLTLTPPTETRLADMANAYSMDYDPLMLSMVKPILDEGQMIARDKGEIDFTDMIWLPYEWNLQPIAYNNVFIDECQDLGVAQLALALKLMGSDGYGRMMFVGDARQAIMAFAGADAESWAKIQTSTNAKQLPLSICYRCPTSHLELAREIVPQIEPAPWAKPGTLATLDEEAFIAGVQEGDMVLCRRYAPLIKHCLKLIGQGRPARIRGRQIGRQLADVARRISKMKFRAGDDFLDLLDDWHEKETAKLIKRDAAEGLFENLDDQALCLTQCYLSFGKLNGEALAARIEEIFSEDAVGITMSSIHRAKGLEADRVWLLDYNNLGVPFPKQSAREAEQEKNLRYVGLTRSKDTLYLVPSQPRAKKGRQ